MLVEVGRLVEDRRPCRTSQPVPGVRGPRRTGDGPLHLGGVGSVHGADALAAIVRAQNGFTGTGRRPSPAVDQRHGEEGGSEGRVDLRRERAAHRSLVERHAAAVAPLGQENLGRPRQPPQHGAAVPLGLDAGHRVPDDLGDRRLLVGQPMHEGGVGAVLQEPPHQVRHQVLVRPHRRIDAAGGARPAVAADHLLVERLAHAMQPLELEGPGGGGSNADGGNRQRVMRGELRDECHRLGEQEPHAGEPGDIGVPLARQHRIVGKAALLRPLDLAVPVGALDEAHGDRLARLCRQPAQPAQHRDGPPAVGLHREAEAGPALEGRIAEGRREQVERQVEAVLLLGIDGEPDSAAARSRREFDEPRQQLARQTLLLAGVEARMQRGELHGNAGPRRQVARPQPGSGRVRLANRLDRRQVAAEVPIGILCRARPLAQHVEGEAVAFGFQRRGARQRLVDGPPEDEAVAQHPHGLAQRLADDGLARTADEPLQDGGGPRPLVPAQPHHPAREHQAEGRGVDEQAVGAAEVLFPVAAADLLGDQRIGGILVGNAQQRLRQAHQDDAFLRGKAVLMHEGIDAAVLVAVAAGSPHQPGGEVHDAGALVRREGWRARRGRPSARLRPSGGGRRFPRARGQTPRERGQTLARVRPLARTLVMKRRRW